MPSQQALATGQRSRNAVERKKQGMSMRPAGPVCKAHLHRPSVVDSGPAFGSASGIPGLAAHSSTENAVFIFEIESNATKHSLWVNVVPRAQLGFGIEGFLSTE